MTKKFNYETPVMEKLELVQEGVLCSSERNGGIDLLNPTIDWSDIWNN